MKQITRVLCLMLCLALLPLPSLAEDAAQSAPIIRVLLRRLNLTDRADLTLDGVYTALTGTGAAMAFPKGSQVTVQIRSGQLYLFYQGMSLSAGASLRLTRNASDSASTEGLRFEKGGNFYPGDLSLTIENGQLQPVLSICVEDYLLGVIPYEMSDSFPLEALKAQAVCARTYALSHVNPSRAWDVVDTTNDQVFKGVNLGYANALRAVEETAGVVGTYKGALATCYYSASNGGQTELVENVWSGQGDWGYYAMTDDPYDLENPESVVRRAKLSKSGSGLPEAFVTVVANYMASEMLKRGFEPLPEAFRIDGISAMSLGAPKHAEPSRMMSEMTLTFSWSGRKILSWPGQETAAPTQAAQATASGDEELLLFATPTLAASPTPSQAPLSTVNSLLTAVTATPEPTPEPTPIYSEFIPVEEEATITLPLFPEVIRALKLSISGTDNEMVTLIEEDGAFVLEARRFGHGVGMSQRGAQWMAGQYGKPFHEILSFYYPGMVLMKAQSGAPALPTAQPELIQSPAPPATPTPRPTLMPVTGALPQGAYLASVEGVDDDSSLNLRAEPNTASEILMRLYKHQLLVVLEACEDPAWVHVKTDVAEGYVMLSFLEKVE